MSELPKVLVVDDEECVRMVLCSLLEESGFAACSAGDGVQALAMLDECTPEIVFTDLNMPVMGGLELIARLKDLVPDVPIVVVSGTGDMQCAIEAIRRGAWEYLIKPVGIDALRHVTNRAMERSLLIRENRAYQERLEELVMERTRELRDSEIRYRTLFESANDAIILIQSGCIESCNCRAAEMLGYPQEEICGRSLLSFAPPQQLDGSCSAEVHARHEQLAMAGCAQSYEWLHKRGNGRYLDTEISLNRLELHGVPHLMAVIRDITERKKAEAALLENICIKRDLDMAREIQRSLLPDAPPRIPGIRVACCCSPAASVGGDYYDFFDVQPGVADIVIADVAGHSLGSALLMSEARTVLRAKVRIERPPAMLLSAVNQLLHVDLSRSELQMSAFAVRLDTRDRLLRYANAGHTRPLYFRAATGSIEELDAEGLLFGVYSEVNFEEKVLQLSAGDILLLHTDGVIDTENPAGEFFGTERLSRLVRAAGEQEPEELLSMIFRALINFAGERQLSDDVSLVVVKILPELF